tara:strand:- start:1407 stop:1559 length:153 start_codon:yes stop_codon:yes gene_type:complete
MKDLKIGQKLSYENVTPFGKLITTQVTIVAIFGSEVLMSNGKTFHSINLK